MTSTFCSAGEWFYTEDGLKMWIWNPDLWSAEILENQNDEPGYLEGKATIKWTNKKTKKTYVEKWFFSSGMGIEDRTANYHMGSKPPSDEDLIFTYEGYHVTDNILLNTRKADSNFIMKIHGRAEASEKGHAQIVYATVGFFNYKKDGEENYTPKYTELIPIILIKLDSNMWIMQYHTEQVIVKKAEK